MLILRDYQNEAVQAHFDFFTSHPDPADNPLFVMPTGSGKSITISEFLARSLKQWPQCRFLVVTHVRELIRQNYDEFVGHIGRPLQQVAGIYSAGMNRRDVGYPVIFAGIQSIYDRAEDLGHFDVVLVDEAHLIPKKGEGRYLTYLAALRKINPVVRVCGYTATHFRLDGGYLHKGKDRLFSHVAYTVRVEMLVQRGFLAPLVARQPEHVIDTSNVGTASTGDFKADELEAAAREDDCVRDAIDEVVRIGRAEDRRSWLFFATGKAHAGDIVAELAKHEVEAVAVFGDTDNRERDLVIDRFCRGDLQALVNVGVLTTGFNAPRVDLMAVMRPTQSASLYVQIMGRGMRVFPGKKNCLVLDYGENVARHGPINAVKPKQEGDGDKGPPPTKVCPECREILIVGTNPCPSCGHLWLQGEMRVDHARMASHLCPIDLDAGKPRVMDVSGWFFRRHEKEGRPPTLRVDFMTGMKTITDWVCPEHEGWPGRKAARWWRDRGGLLPAPATVDAAIARRSELRLPIAIEVVDDGEYLRVSRMLGVQDRETSAQTPGLPPGGRL